MINLLRVSPETRRTIKEQAIEELQEEIFIIWITISMPPESLDFLIDSFKELLALAKEYGYELPPEQLEAIAGGWCITKCHLYNPDCGTFGVPV